MDVLGIDIGGSSVKVTAIREGQVLWTGRSSPYRDPGRQDLVLAIRGALGGRDAGRPARAGPSACASPAYWTSPKSE